MTVWDTDPNMHQSRMHLTGYDQEGGQLGNHYMTCAIAAEAYIGNSPFHYLYPNPLRLRRHTQCE